MRHVLIGAGVGVTSWAAYHAGSVVDRIETNHDLPPRLDLTFLTVAAVAALGVFLTLKIVNMLIGGGRDV